jgi:nucleotide-binding universal stress UspA family protein
MYKTILLHCNDKHRIKTLLAPALFIADQFEAHLVAVSVVPPPIVAGPALVIDEHCKVYRADSAEMRVAFEEATRGRTLVPEWRDEDRGGCSVLDSLLQHARAADLIIASQTDPSKRGTFDLDLADRLAVEAGRPVLIIPSVLPQADRLGEKVLVAWNARREAARAVFDALPILRSATQVKVVAVNPQTEREVAHDLPTADICAALARHGVKCEGAEEVKPRRGVGETLLACAQEFGADLLIMGCYGHTRWREFILGGATRHVLSHATLPVLMSH